METLAHPVQWEWEIVRVTYKILGVWDIPIHPSPLCRSQSYFLYREDFYLALISTSLNMILDLLEFLSSLSVMSRVLQMLWFWKHKSSRIWQKSSLSPSHLQELSRHWKSEGSQSNLMHWYVLEFRIRINMCYQCFSTTLPSILPRDLII